MIQNNRESTNYLRSCAFWNWMFKKELSIKYFSERVVVKQLGVVEEASFHGTQNTNHWK
jgi:hypothetical protein